MASAGRILIMPQGEWRADGAYSMLDLVSHNGSSWIARQDSIGVEPSKDNDDFWQQMSDFSLLDEKKLDKERTAKTLKAGESYKHTFSYGECCLLCVFFDGMHYASIMSCCGINEWSYSINKLNELTYGTQFTATPGTVSGTDLNTITFTNGNDKDGILEMTKLPIFPL